MSSDDRSDREQQFDQVLAEYYQEIEAGRPPDTEAFLRRHADFADELRSFFADKARFEQAASPLAPPPAANPADAPTLAPGDSTPAPAVLDRVRYFGDYELVREVARGGMGVVYEARQVSLNRVVALKMILAGGLASDQDVQRFRVEAEAAGTLDHPNIVPVYEVGEHQGQQYFSMKFVDGGTLGGRAMPGTRQTFQQVARQMAEVARAVHHAHQRGILHRDLKPSNILLDREGRPHVSDFGLARRVEGEAGLTQTGAILGTPSYMPPEQASGQKRLTTAADVYSLGAVLYELLTGRPPFRADSPLNTLLQVLDRDPARPRSLNRSVPVDLETICLKCLQKDPQRRYDSAAALADDLERWLRHEPIRARRVGWGGRLWRWCRRKPALAAASFLALVALVAAVGIGAAAWWEDRLATQRSYIRAAEAERNGGNREEALRYIGLARDLFTDEALEQEAVQTVTLSDVVLRGKTQLNQDIRVGDLSPDEARIETVGPDEVRLRLKGKVQVRRIPGCDLVSETNAPTESPSKPPELPEKAKLLGQGVGDRWAVVRLATGEVVRWDATAGKAADTLPDVGPVPDQVTVSGDGRRLAYVDPLSPQTLRVWDWDEKQFVGVLDLGRPGPTSVPPLRQAAGLSPDGTLLAAYGNRDGRAVLKVWDVEAGVCIASREGISYRGGAWSPDGHWLITVGSDVPFLIPRGGYYPIVGTLIHCWEVLRPCPSYRQDVGRGFFQFDPSGKRLVAAGSLWELRSNGGEHTLGRLTRHGTDLSFGSDGSLWARRVDEDSNTRQQSLHLERLGGQAESYTVPLPQTRQPAAPPDTFQRVRAWVAHPETRRAVVALEAVDLKPDEQGGKPVWWLRDRVLLEWWDLEKSQRLAVLEGGPLEWFQAVGLGPGGRHVYALSWEGARVWDTFSGRLIRTRSRDEGVWEGRARLMADGQLVVYRTPPDRWPYVVEVEDLASGEIRGRLELQHEGRILALHPGKWLAVNVQSGRRPGVIEVWDLRTGKRHLRWEAHSGETRSACFSPDGRLLVTAGWDGTMRLWDLDWINAQLAELKVR